MGDLLRARRPVDGAAGWLGLDSGQQADDGNEADGEPRRPLTLRKSEGHDARDEHDGEDGQATPAEFCEGSEDHVESMTRLRRRVQEAGGGG